MGNYTVSFYDRDMNRRFFRHFENVQIQELDNYIRVTDKNDNLLLLVSVCANTIIIESDNSYLDE
ncbi:MAG: hypothetical protein IKP69_10795 [Oscillospiraceae bacterium]|nr:hypothetical protein [Oscillospiraceae bacterium]